jgi:hypothetical protein
MEYWKELSGYTNMRIFENHNLSMARVCNQILQDLGENKKFVIF